MAYLLQAVVGIAIGSIIGLLVILVTKKTTFLLVDAILGAAGFVGGAIAAAKIPYKMNTVSQRIGDTIVTTTSRHNQHPYRAALLLAVLLPVLFEAYRLKVHPLLKRSSIST